MAAVLVVASVVSLMSCVAFSEASLLSTESFSLNLDASDQQVCVDDDPSKQQSVASNSQCAFLCLAQAKCSQYNYLKANTTCQLLKERIFPSHKVAVVGKKVVLECRSSSPVGLWTFTPVNVSRPVAIVKNFEVMEPFTDQYAVDTSDRGCNLIINSVSMNQSGKYACTIQQSPKYIDACGVLVLQSKPSCTTNITNGSLLTMEWLEVTCLTNTNRSDELSMICRDLSGSPVGIPGLTTDNSISFYIQAGGPPVLQPFVCTLTIKIQLSPIIDGAVNYVSYWTTPRFNVSCPVGFDFVAGANGCYLVINELMNWSNASARCQQLNGGAYSAIIMNAAEHSAISSYLDANMSSTCYFTDSYAPGFHVWTAGQRQTPSYNSPFVWKPNANTALPFAYTKWYPSEPSCGPNGSSDFCVLLVGQVTYVWHDGSCNLPCCALCEYGPY